MGPAQEMREEEEVGGVEGGGEKQAEIIIVATWLASTDNKTVEENRANFYLWRTIWIRIFFLLFLLLLLATQKQFCCQAPVSAFLSFLFCVIRLCVNKERRRVKGEEIISGKSM